MKKILGLDIGTNSIGAALINIDEFGKSGSIEWMGSRIIPLDGDSMSKFENGGQVETKAANRRLLRGSRRLKQRYKLRRNRLIKVFKLLKWVNSDFPENFKQIGKQEGFTFNINNFLPISETSRNEAYEAFGTDRVSEDWLVYFLRKKALEQKITFQELARIIYMLNQRRGFKSSRKEIKPEEENAEEKWPKIEKWVEILQVINITEISKNKDKFTFNVTAGNYSGEIIRRSKPDWQGRELELEVTRKTTKSLEETYSFKIPDTSDWEKQKSALHKDIYLWMNEGLCKTIGEYFFIHLRENKNYRIRQRIVERELYKQELQAIWEAQKKYHSELSETEILPIIAKELYHINTAKQKEISDNDLLYVFANDIIYYQRALRSQKHSIDVCRFEKRTYREGGETISMGVKVAPKSSPEFQEFRIWQDIHNIRVYEKNGGNDVTETYINVEGKANLYKLFDSNSEISATAILKNINKKLTDGTHKVNLFANREKLKGNETKAVFRKVFKKHSYEHGEQLLQDNAIFYKLWHILYSLNEQKDLKSALTKLKSENGTPINIPEAVVDHLSKLPELPKQYAAYSSKAIKKLLPLMRCGSYWNATHLAPSVAERIEKTVRHEIDENIDTHTAALINKFSLQNENYYSGMPVWLATYVVYGKHAERTSDEKYTNHEQIEVNKLIPANSLRNPFVEKVIRETLQVVKDIFEKYGQPDEIHIELARELKKTAEEKSQISEANNKNFAEKERIKKLLSEFKEGNPQSLADIEKFRLWKANGGFESNKRFEDLFNKRNEFITISEIEKYRLWADQNHLSPYTGKPIPLSLLFNKAAYEIEHIFPRSRFFDDSFANKVICEAGVNKEKDNRIARLFIQQYSGRTFENGGKVFDILDEEAYVEHCKKTFKGKKLRNLLAESIPEDFVSRQLNDTRYISKKLSELLYPVAKEKEGIIFSGGSISNELKEKWGLNKVWKEILKSRFERLERITGEPMIIPDNTDINKFHFAKDYKRVDHRHHALDALIIAATTREHIRYLNTLNATDNDEKKSLKYGLVNNGIRDFMQPWPLFTKEAKEKLNEIIVSHKTTNRVVTKPFNNYLKWTEKDGIYIKEIVKQLQPKDFDKSWTAVRRSMFKEPQGIIYLKEIVQKKLTDAIAIQIKKDQTLNKKGQQPADYIYDQRIRPEIKTLIKKYNGDILAIKASLKKNPLKDDTGKLIDKVPVAEFKEYAAKRVTLDASFDDKKIDKIPYAHHQPSNGKKQTLAQMLREHLQDQGKPELAFTGEGLDILHRKVGYPLKKVTIYEAKDPETKFKGKYYETDKGGNVFFIITLNAKGERVKMYTLPLLEAIERLANKLPLADTEEGESFFTLSPNELVYVPEEEENIKGVNWSDKATLFEKVYKVVSFTKSQCFFIPHFISKSLSDDSTELGANNKSERAWNGIMIKSNCIKLKIDRLGNINPVL
jgi:CRISPR-associated endonuclease Csn1